MRPTTTAELRLDEGKPPSSGAVRRAILGFRPQGIHNGRCWLRRQPKSETMALVGMRIRGILVDSLRPGQLVKCV
jgi:hypothetical protein